MVASDLKAGMIVRHEGQLYQVMVAETHKGGGKTGAMEHVKLRNLNSGVVLERRLRPDEKVEAVDVEKQTMEYLYREGDYYVFMNPKTYEQAPVHISQLGDRARLLMENLAVTALSLEGVMIHVEFPAHVDLRVITSPPPIHEQETSTYKSVTLENQMEILVPQFIKEGDVVRVDVATGKYLERA